MRPGYLICTGSFANPCHLDTMLRIHRTPRSFCTLSTTACAFQDRTKGSYDPQLFASIAMTIIRDIEAPRYRCDYLQRFQYCLPSLFSMSSRRIDFLYRLRLVILGSLGARSRCRRIRRSHRCPIAHPLPLRLDRGFGVATYPSCGVGCRPCEPSLTLL